LDPDVLAVQEVGDPTALRELAERIGGGYDHAVTAAPDGRGIRVGFLSRLPLANVREVETFAPGLRGIQTDDSDVPETSMGRPAVTGGPIGTSLEDNPKDRRNDPGSDHRLLVVDIRLTP
jgi:hypothetical protein